MDMQRHLLNVSMGPATQRLLAAAPPLDTLESLRDALLKALSEVQSLKAQNQALKQQVELQKENGTRQKKELKRVNKKQRARTKADVDNLALLATVANERKSQTEHADMKYKALEEAMYQKLRERDQIWGREVALLQRERQLTKEKWTKREERWRRERRADAILRTLIKQQHTFASRKKLRQTAADGGEQERQTAADGGELIRQTAAEGGGQERQTAAEGGGQERQTVAEEVQERSPHETSTTVPLLTSTTPPCLYPAPTHCPCIISLPPSAYIQFSPVLPQLHPK